MSDELLDIPHISDPRWPEVMRQLSEIGHGEWVLGFDRATAADDLVLSEEWAAVPGAVLTLGPGKYTVTASFDLEVEDAGAIGALLVGGIRQEDETILKASGRVRGDAGRSWMLETHEPLVAQLQARRVAGSSARCRAERTALGFLRNG